MEDSYKISKKGKDGKWYTFGNFKKNQWGNYSLGIKVDKVFKHIVETSREDSWINFSAFEDKPKQEFKRKKEDEFIERDFDDIGF